MVLIFCVWVWNWNTQIIAMSHVIKPDNYWCNQSVSHLVSHSVTGHLRLVILRLGSELSNTCDSWGLVHSVPVNSFSQTVHSHCSAPTCGKHMKACHMPILMTSRKTGRALQREHLIEVYRACIVLPFSHGWHHHPRTHFMLVFCDCYQQTPPSSHTETFHCSLKGPSRSSFSSSKSSWWMFMSVKSLSQKQMKEVLMNVSDAGWQRSESGWGTDRSRSLEGVWRSYGYE